MDKSAAAIEDKCVNHFGVAGHHSEAGFMLRDGTFLRFFDPSTEMHRREHHEIGECLPIAKPGEPEHAVDWFMDKTGAMRVGGSGGVIFYHSAAKYRPSKAQARYIGKILRADGVGAFDITLPDGTTCASQTGGSWGDYLRAVDRCKLEEP